MPTAMIGPKLLQGCSTAALHASGVKAPLTCGCHIPQGHFQIVLDTDRCPLFLDGLSWFQKIMYCSGVWAYVVGALSTPFFVVVPLVTIWAGIFPIIVSWWAARAPLALVSMPFPPPRDGCCLCSWA